MDQPYLLIQAYVDLGGLCKNEVDSLLYIYIYIYVPNNIKRFQGTGGGIIVKIS